MNEFDAIAAVIYTANNNHAAIELDLFGTTSSST